MELLKTWLLLAYVAGSYAAPFSALESQHCSTQTCNAENPRYLVGQTYIYRYTAESSTWINGTTEQKSSLKFDCSAEISAISPCELTLTLHNVDAFESNANGDMVAASDPDMARELEEHVLRFAFHEGAVTDVCPTGDEKTWTLNFKRAVLSAIQAPVTEIPTEQVEEVIAETDVTGKCPTTNTRSEFPRTIVKLRDYKNCEHHSKIEGLVKATILTPDAPLFNIVDCTMECDVTFEENSDIVAQSNCRERHLSKAFSKQSSGAVTVVTVAMTLDEVAERAAPTGTIVQRRTTILFESEDAQVQTEEVLARVRGILTALNRRAAEPVGTELPNLFSDLVTEMRKVETLADMTELKNFAEGESEALYAVFKDALAMCETTASVETMAAIIAEVAASPDEAVKSSFGPTRITWLTLPSMTRHPTKEMISALMPLIQTLSVEDSVFFLPISSLINRYCTSENPACLEEAVVRQALAYFEQLLGTDCTPSEEVPHLKMLMALKALTNARRLSTDSKISTISRCFDLHDPAKEMEIRIAALEVVRRLPCKPEYQTHTKAVYSNRVFDNELRIAAYRAMMTCPSEDIMEAIKDVLSEETSDQVASYVWTHLSNLNETSDPQKQHLKRWVLDSGIMGLPPKLDLRKASRNVELSYYNNEMASGLTVDADMVFSDKSFLPRELRVNNTFSIFGYAVNAFEIGGRVEGVHHILETFFGPRGYLRENSVQDLVKEYQQKQQEAFLAGLPDAPAAEDRLPEGLPDGISLDMYNRLLRMLQFQRKVFDGNLPLPIPGQPMPKGMPAGMTQAMYDDLLVYFARAGLPGGGAARRKRHLVREATWNDVQSQYHANVEDQPHASVYFKMFGNEIAYVDLEKIKNRLTEMKSSMNPMKLLMSLAKEQTHELSKNALVLDSSWTTPTLMGLPLKLAINGSFSLKIRTEGKLDMRGILMSPRSFEINGVVEPSVALEVSSSMEVTARQTRSGLNHVARLHSSVSLGGKIQVTNGKAFVLEVKVPDEKQEIIDVSSSIYLRLRDEPVELPGIPERLESSLCSGSLTTKYFGTQICAGIAFPKSYARKEYPLFPLTGPAHMLVTVEKSDPSLTSWKLEGSYGLEKETVLGHTVLSDRFHLMFGAPDTDIPRTFQVDVSFDRNEKVLNFNAITPVKTVDLYGKLTNNPMLRKLETTLTLDKTSVYTLDAEVESRPSVEDGDPVINFYPRLDVTSPRGNVVQYRSSISVRDGQQTRVHMWMSLDSPRTALVTILGDVVKTESPRKVRYSTDLQITGRYVNANVSGAWQKQKRDDIVTLDATVQRLVNGRIVKDVVLTAKYTNRTTEDQKEWDFKTECMLTRYPLLSFLLEYEYIGTSHSSETTGKMCYRYNGEECSQDTKVVVNNLLTWESSESQTVENLNLKIRNPANNINLEFRQHAVSNATHPVDFAFVVLNKTSELEVLNAGLRARSPSQEPVKGDFEASLRSQTWRYAVLQDWEIVRDGKAVLNTALHWEDQQATFGINYTPTSDEETGLSRYDFDTLLTYPLGRVSVNWYAWKRGYDISHGASASLIDQSLFAYRIDYTNHTVDAGQPDVKLDASFNITRPMSPISVALHASSKNYQVAAGFNVTRGETKTFTSGFSQTVVLNEDTPPETNMRFFTDVDIPERDFSLSILNVMSEQVLAWRIMTSKQEQSVHLNGRLIYYQNTIFTMAPTNEEYRYDITYDVTQNMSHPLPEYDHRFIFSMVGGNVDTQLTVHKSKTPVLFLKLDYDKTTPRADKADGTNQLPDKTDRHQVRFVLRTPMAVMKNVQWNGTLDLAETGFDFETGLLYFPDQQRPFVVAVSYQDKGNELVTHKELTTSFQTQKRRVSIFNVAKFDLGAGVVLGTASVKMGTLNTEPDMFELSVKYNNKTEEETVSHKLALTLVSPDNVIETEGSVSYVELTSYSTAFSVQVSEESIYSSTSVLTNNSDSNQTAFELENVVNFFGYRYRVHTVHSQDANSFHPNVKLYRGEETEPMAEADVTYRMAEGIPTMHRVIVTLKSEETEPLTISTLYINGAMGQNVEVVLSTSAYEETSISFSAGRTDTKSENYDFTFRVWSTYLPNQVIELTTYFGIGSDQYNVTSYLIISNEHVLNVVYQCEDTSPSDAHTRKNARLELGFPQLTDYPALLHLGLRLDWEDQRDVSLMRKGQLRWGQMTDEEAVTLTATLRGDALEVQVVHPMSLLHLPNEINLILQGNVDESAEASFQIRVNDEDVKLMSVSGSYALVDGNVNKRRGILAFSRPEHTDIEITLDGEVMNENTIFGSDLTIKYSEEENRLVTAMIEVVNQTTADSMGFDINAALRHLVTGLDMSTALSVMNDKKAASAGIEGEILVDGEPRPFTFEFKWDKEREEYTIISDSPWNEMMFTGRFVDASYSDFKIYQVTMTNTYRDDRTVQSMFEYNSQSKEISYKVNHDPDNPEDFMRFREGFLNETALLSLLDSELDGQYAVDARLLFALETPKILQTHLQWNPDWVELIREKFIATYDRLTNSSETRREDSEGSRTSIRELICASYEDFLTDNADLQTTLESMQEALLVKYEAKKERFDALKEYLETRLQSYVRQLEENLEPTREQLEAQWGAVTVKLENWYAEMSAIAEAYTSTTEQRVKDFYNMHVKPIFEELKEMFQNLAEQHRFQMDLLFPAIRPYGNDYLLPEPEPEPETHMWPLYQVGGKEDTASTEDIVETSITVPDERVVVFTNHLARLRQMRIWRDIERLWNETKAEFEAILVEIDEEFKQSNVYLDLMEQWEELKERFPAEQWKADLEARLEEIKDSEEVQELIATLQLLREELSLPTIDAAAGLTRIRERIADSLRGYGSEIVAYLRRPIYELSRNDLEGGEILLRLFLPTEVHSLQEAPASWRQWEMLQRLRELIAEVRERSKRTLGQIALADGSSRSLYELILNEPVLLYREGNLDQWFLGEKIKAQRKFWEVVHLAKMYINPINWIPPHQADAVIVGANHYMTFDRTFYDFSSGCSYLLAHDFIDGNFTVFVEYNRGGSSRTKSIVLYLNSTTSFEIQSDFTVMKGKQFLELPVQHGRTTITRDVNNVRIHNTNGVTVTCHVARDVCTVNVSGWYFGKTAGLLGTYNYEARDDFTAAGGELARHTDAFARSWKVGKRCSGLASDPLPQCNSDPEQAANALCSAQFLEATSGLTQCLGVVDPMPFYSMCASKMCVLTTEQERRDEACRAVKAYVDECNRLAVGIAMPDICVVCDSPDGQFNQGETKTLSDPEDIPLSADVILIVEEKHCNEDKLEHIAEIIDILDTQLKATHNFADNRFGLLGFGGKGIHNLPHVHTIDGQLFNEKRPLRFQGLPELEFAENGSNDTFASLLAAASYPFRAGVAKHIILLSCSNCQRLYHTDKYYKDLAGVLLKQGIQLNLLLDTELELVPTRGKNTSPKNQIIYGIDNRTVFTNKAMSSGRLVGDKSLRKLVDEPVTQCALLAFESGGALFDATKMDQKKFADVLTQRMVERTVVEPCQVCSCRADADGVGRAICEPCRFAGMHPWLFDLERDIAEAYYYGRHGFQSFMDYLNAPSTESETSPDTPVNKTPKKQP